MQPSKPAHVDYAQHTPISPLFVRYIHIRYVSIRFVYVASPYKKRHANTPYQYVTYLYSTYKKTARKHTLLVCDVPLQYVKYIRSMKHTILVRNIHFMAYKHPELV